MRTVLLILFVILLVGCAHQPKSYVGYIRDPQELEKICELIQEEIKILKRTLSQREASRIPEPLADLAGKRREAALRARNAYSHDQRVRDLQEMVRILDRQKDALAAEVNAYHDGIHIDFE